MFLETDDFAPRLRAHEIAGRALRGGAAPRGVRHGRRVPRPLRQQVGPDRPERARENARPVRRPRQSDECDRAQRIPPAAGRRSGSACRGRGHPLRLGALGDAERLCHGDRHSRKPSTTSTASRRRSSTCAIPRPGDPALAARVAALVTSERVRLDPGRGLDHGAWSVLIAMFPAADIPVVQLSMDTSAARAASLRSGAAARAAPRRGRCWSSRAATWCTTCSLFRLQRPEAPLDWALGDDARSREPSPGGRHDELAGYPGPDAEARLAVPTPEHYLPLLYAVALQQPGETADFFNVRVSARSR